MNQIPNRARFVNWATIPNAILTPSGYRRRGSFIMESNSFFAIIKFNSRAHMRKPELMMFGASRWQTANIFSIEIVAMLQTPMKSAIFLYWDNDISENLSHRHIDIYLQLI